MLKHLIRKPHDYKMMDIILITLIDQLLFIFAAMADFNVYSQQQKNLITFSVSTENQLESYFRTEGNVRSEGEILKVRFPNSAV